MRFSSDDRSIFKAYVVALVTLFALYIIPVIIFDFQGLDPPQMPDALLWLGETVFHYFFLIGVPTISLLLGALSLGMLGKAPEGSARFFPKYIGYLMLTVTMLSIVIWIIDLSMY